MARGTQEQSPTNVTHYLKGIDLPASKEDLLEHAKENGADDAVLEMIESMPDDEFETMADVMKAYGEADKEMGGAAQDRE